MFASEKDKNGASVADGTLEWLESLVYGDLFPLARARRVFAKLDLDSDGSLTPAELVAVLRASGASEVKAVATAGKIFDISDGNMKRQVSCEEFVAFVRTKNSVSGETTEEILSWFENLYFGFPSYDFRARRVFTKLDLDGDGLLTCAELVTLLRASGASEDEAQATTLKILELADENIDRQVSCEEFVAFAHKKDSLLGKSVEETLAWFEALVFGFPFMECRARSVFAKFDSDKDGVLTVSELMTMMQASGISEDESMAKACRILDLADENMDRQVTCDEFVTFVHRKEAAFGQSAEATLSWFEALVYGTSFLEVRARAVFDKIDLDKNGSVTASELKTLLLCAGFSEKEAQRATSWIIRVADDDGNEGIDVEEFVSLVTKKFQVVDTTPDKALSYFENLVIGETYLRARATRIFRQMDFNGDGSVSASELITLLIAAGSSEFSALATTNQIIGLADTDLNSSLELDEFIDFILHKVFRSQRLFPQSFSFVSSRRESLLV